MFTRFLCIIFLLSFIVPLRGQSDYSEEIKKYTAGLPFEIGVIKTPAFKDKIYIITDFGAVPDGQILNTDAFNKAMTKCSENGGGKVIVPPGLWITGPIRLQSNVDLHLERGALILFSRNHEDYPIVRYPEKGYSVQSPVSGIDLENVAITGEGILDGAGDTWRPVKKAKLTPSQWQKLMNSGGYFDSKNSIWYPSQEAYDGLENIKLLKGKKDISEINYIPYRESMRPYMVMLINCKNVFLNDITIENSPKFALYPIRCSNVIFRKVKINNEWWAQNGDAMDISACKNVLIYNCTINAGDDGICMKAGSIKNYGKPVLENIVIADCVVYHAHGGFVIGSETDGGIKNISVRDCNFIGTDIGLRFKSAKDRGGLVENISIDGIYMKDIANEAVLFDFSYEQNLDGNKNKEEKLPIFRNFRMNKIVCSGAESAVYINALPDSPVKDISINNSYFETTSGVNVSFASSVSFDNVGFKIKGDNLVILDQSDKINFSNITFSENVKSFISLKGDKTSEIRITGTNLSKLNAPVKYSQDVNSNSILIQ